MSQLTHKQHAALVFISLFLMVLITILASAFVVLMSSTKTDIDSAILVCKHCGDQCAKKEFVIDEIVFCCNGCKTVYQFLNSNGLSAYYQYESNPGTSRRKAKNENFDYLDNQKLVRKLLNFNEGDTSIVSFHLPQIHCSSCLYLLENISKIEPGIIKSRVSFVAKEVSISYNNKITSLKAIVLLLRKIGYEPRINYSNIDGTKQTSKYDRSLLYKLGLAGFSFGNIMLLSFPEYLGFDKASYLFSIGYINIILATPVLLYSGKDYLKNAWKGILMSNLNIDLPIALGMITLYLRSVYEIIGQYGEGYLDSFAGFIFFLLIGRWFQTFTSQVLDFDRNYKSYFPISATVNVAGKWTSKSLDHVKTGDLIRIKNQQLIPVDGILQKGKARIDYSFVTGESDYVAKSIGEELFAGGRHQGSIIEIEATKDVNQSYLTKLWNEDAFNKKEDSSSKKLIQLISKYFTLGVLVIALATMFYWLLLDSSEAFIIFTSVLIVACPCALALAIPFTYGNILRLLVTKGLYLKNVSTIEDIQDVDYIIFDKTGTITDNKNIKIEYYGNVLSENELNFLVSACSHSSHPLSKAILANYPDVPIMDIDSYEDFVGEGFVASLDDVTLRIGSSDFIFGTEVRQRERGVFVEMNNKYLGCFKFYHEIRPQAKEIVQGILTNYKIGLLSGDTESEKSNMQTIFGSDENLYFGQSPKDKLKHIKKLQEQGHKVMMIGDGLNDAGALQQSDVGLVISEAVNNFSPACDGILDANYFQLLLKFINYIKTARYIIYGAFVLAILYNGIGLYFAVSGKLSPVIAAILMPLSSISVILYGVLSSYLIYQYYFSNSFRYYE